MSHSTQSQKSRTQKTKEWTRRTLDKVLLFTVEDHLVLWVFDFRDLLSVLVLDFLTALFEAGAFFH